MMTRMRLALVGLLVLVALGNGLFVALLSAPGAAAANSAVPATLAAEPDTLHVDQQRLESLPFDKMSFLRSNSDAWSALANYAVGETRLFPTLNDALGIFEFRTFTLKAIGEQGEVWLANDLQFPLGDCRGQVVVTQQQIDYLLNEFDTKIRKTDTEYFGQPKTRDGSKATLPRQLGIPSDYYAGSTRDVILIDNIRDENFYLFPSVTGYIGGFFAGAFATALNRNVITIDAFDWQHRTGPNPPNEPNPANPCRNRRAIPFLYEGTFAHEYQHLIHFDYDPDEESWVNEGMSDFAEFVNKYSFPNLTINDVGYDSHTQSFFGFVAQLINANGKQIPIALSGPENSLVLWGDQGDNEILADYGIAYSFMLYVNEKFGGAKFMRYWQNSTKLGIAGFEDALAQFGYQTTFAQVYHDFAVAMAVDYLIDQGVSGPNPGGRYGLTTQRAQLSFNTTEAYGTPGAPPYGSDYVKVADLAGLSALNFAGAPNIVRETPWTSSASGPANWAGGAVLRSGHVHNSEAWLARQVTLGPGTQTLSFDTYFDIEECYDYAAVRVSTDGGQTFTSLANDLTDDCVPSDGQDPRVSEILPGFTGQTPAWTKATFDLSAYAGQTILLAFEYVTDPAAAGNDASATNNGLWLDNIAINGRILSDGSAASLAEFGDITAFQPIATAFTVQIVGFGANAFTVMQLPLADGKNGALTPAQLAELAAYEYLVAIITYDAPTGPEKIGPGPDYASYALTVTRNGETVTMPGGSKQVRR